MQVILISYYYLQIFHLKHILIAYHAHASHYPFLHVLPHFITCHSSPQLHYPSIITIAKSKMSRCSSGGGDKCIQNVRKPFQELTFGNWRNMKMVNLRILGHQVLWLQKGWNWLSIVNVVLMVVTFGFCHHNSLHSHPKCATINSLIFSPNLIINTIGNTLMYWWVLHGA